MPEKHLKTLHSNETYLGLDIILKLEAIKQRIKT